MNETTDSTSLQLQKRFYHPLCTPAEIERVFNPQNAKDYLLALRAHYIVDNIRIFRFFLRAWRAQGEGYSLERNFDDTHYRDYLAMLVAEDRERLSSVAFGDVFTKEPTGEIFCSPFGRIVTISRSLRYFLEYSHLALKRLSVEIPLEVRFAALIILVVVLGNAQHFSKERRTPFKHSVEFEDCGNLHTGFRRQSVLFSPYLQQLGSDFV